MEGLNLSAEQLDALKEIGNVGAGNAATALSQLLGRRVDINVPQVELLNLQGFSGSGLLSKDEELGLVVSLKILGKLKGGMWVLFPHQSILLMVDILTRKKIGSTELFNLEDEALFSETSHILCCSYLNAIGEFLKLSQLIPSITQISMDRVDRLSGVLIKKSLSEGVNYILPIENNMVVADAQLKLFVIFLLEYDSVNKTLKLVGL